MGWVGCWARLAWCGSGGMSCACAQPPGASPNSLKGVLVQHLWGRWRGTVCHRSRAGLAPRHGSSICSCRKPSCSLLFRPHSQPKVPGNPCSELAPRKALCSIKSQAPWEEPPSIRIFLEIPDDEQISPTDWSGCSWKADLGGKGL